MIEFNSLILNFSNNYIETKNMQPQVIWRGSGLEDIILESYIAFTFWY